MKALIIIVAIFIVCFIGMLVVTHNAIPYDHSWDDDLEEDDK